METVESCSYCREFMLELTLDTNARIGWPCDYAGTPMPLAGRLRLSWSLAECVHVPSRAAWGWFRATFRRFPLREIPKIVR